MLQISLFQLYRIGGTKCKKPFNAVSSDVDLIPKMNYEIQFKMIVDKSSKPTLVTLDDLFDVVDGQRICELFVYLLQASYISLKFQPFLDTSEDMVTVLTYLTERFKLTNSYFYVLKYQVHSILFTIRYTS